ncbi:MAG: hypothetical protein KF729_14435 [Sandaracinaceae bacterium]|nr:hypothetical protein [Sandaracinaceae bacterium]
MPNASIAKPLFVAVTLSAALLALAAAAPGRAHAQAGVELGDPVTGATGSTQLVLPPPPRTVTLDPELLALRGEVRRARDVVREGPSFGASWGHAAGGFGIGLGVGAFAGSAIGLGACANQDAWTCPIFMVLGASLGGGGLAPFGAALATWGFGERAGGTGNFFAALGGAYLGAGLGLGVSTIFGLMGEVGAAAIVGPVFGAIATTFFSALFYQATSRGARAPDERAEGVSLVPMLAPVDGGATAGVAGIL